MTQYRVPASVRQIIMSSSSSLVLAALLFSVCINLLALTAPLYMLQVYDRVLTSSSVETLVYLSLIAAGALLAFALLEGIRSRILARVAVRFHDVASTLLLRRGVFMSTVPAAAGRTPSDRDIEQVRAFIGGAPITAFLDFPWIFIFMFFLYVLHPWFFYAACVAAFTLMVLALASEIMTRGRVAKAAAASQMAQMYAASMKRHAELVEGMGMQPAIEKRWMSAQKDSLSGQLAAQDGESKIGSISKFVRLVTQSSMLGLGAYLVILGDATPGVMIAASIVSARALAPIDIAVGSWKTFVGARGAASRINAFLSASGDRMVSQELPPPKGILDVQDATLFLPNSADPVVSSVSMRVEPGQALAIIGPSAAGKTSLLRMMSGIWRPTRGAVRLDGAMVFNWPREQIGDAIGLLPQEVALFNGTVAENIARMKEPDARAVLEAAKKAGVHELVLRLPQGYETVVGEQGVSLSGGQRQRIGLARALYGNPSLVLLDEPNSNLDEAGEAALVECISGLLAEKRTVVIVAHRPNVLKVATHVALMKMGKLEDFGPRDEVLGRLHTVSQKGNAGPAVSGIIRPTDRPPPLKLHPVVVRANKGGDQV